MIATKPRGQPTINTKICIPISKPYIISRNMGNGISKEEKNSPSEVEDKAWAVLPHPDGDM